MATRLPAHLHASAESVAVARGQACAAVRVDGPQWLAIWRPVLKLIHHRTGIVLSQVRSAVKIAGLRCEPLAMAGRSHWHWHAAW